jgi:cytochrome c-type protein NapB
MKNLKPLTLSALAGALAVLITACATITVESMRGTDAAAPDQAPPLKEYVGGRPGAQQAIARTFEQQPPLIPHAMTNFDEVTLEENQCLSCHGPDTYKKKNAPVIGDSHFRDREGKMMQTMSMARYQCSQCHVPQVDAKPLVGSTFQTVAPTAKK